ncbi:insulinase family protein [Candidatus Pacearchaeota archaeon]|nr:insulinase family protein [Candidatus Pacearchaeota archaeon]
MNSQKILSKVIIFLFIWLLVVHSIFPIQERRGRMDPPVKKTLSNGLTLVYQKDDSSAITVLHIVIKGGKGDEPEGKQGLTYLTTRLILEIPDQNKVQKLMSLASRISMLCKVDYSRINIECLSEHLEETLRIVTKIALKPLFSSLRINKIKKEMLFKRETEQDDSINVGHHAHLEKLFGKTGLGGPVLGIEESLNAIKKKDIESFYENHFKANNMIVVVSSNLEQETIADIVKKYFGEFSSGKPTESKSKTILIPEEKESFIKKDTKQSLVSIAFPLPKLTPRNFTLAFMVENLLGKGINSRLWSLRAKQKLAYNINSKATCMKDGGMLEAYLETDNKKKEVALEALKKVLLELFENGITEEDLEDTKINSKTYFLRGNETKETRVQNIDFFIVSGFGFEFSNKFLLEIDKTTLEEINAYIQNVLDPDKHIVIVVGPEDNQ